MYTYFVHWVGEKWYDEESGWRSCLTSINMEIFSGKGGFAAFWRTLDFWNFVTSFVGDTVEDPDTAWEWITQSIKDASKQ